MRYIKGIGLVLLVGLSIACNKEKELNQEEAAAALEAQFAEITELSESVACTDSSDWEFTAYGNKACGGPVGYIAYSKAIDTKDFLKKVKTYTEDQKAYNENFEIASNCTVPTQPKSIACINGKPIFEN